MVSLSDSTFSMFSIAHISAIFILGLSIFLLFIWKNKFKQITINTRVWERGFATSLLAMDILYYVWLIRTGRWDVSDSLPLELCSISLAITIILLWTGNKYLYDFVFYAGIGGALQAIATPVLDINFPHFRYFHFFYTHIGIIVTAIYFTWMKGNQPTFTGVLKTMLILNILLPIIFLMNLPTNGNYMFLRMKPPNGSLLDFLGPYPWYILSLEVVAFFVFTCLWLIFRRWRIDEQGEA